MKVRDLIRLIENDGWYGLEREEVTISINTQPSQVWLLFPASQGMNGARNPEQYFEAGRTQVVKKYLVIVEETSTGYSAYSPDLPGCGSTGGTREEVEQNIREAIEFHIEGLKLEGYEVPEPSSYSSYIDVAA